MPLPHLLGISGQAPVRSKDHLLGHDPLGSYFELEWRHRAIGACVLTADNVTLALKAVWVNGRPQANPIQERFPRRDRLLVVTRIKA